MKIEKILNNSVVVSQNKQKKEIIVMGKGLAYGLHVGDYLDDTKIDKTFYLQDESQTNRFTELISEIPVELFEFTEETISYAADLLGKRIHSYIYVTLTDHIVTMIERAKLNAYVKNAMLWDIKRVYHDEFKVAKKIVERINQKFDTIFDDNEAASIALHFVNAELENDLGATIDITKVITSILDIVKYNFKITYNENSLAYYRFIIHLRFFAQRLFSDSTYDAEDKEFMVHIQQKYQASYDCVQRIKNHVENVYQSKVGDEECMYLTIHIEKVVRNSTKI